MSTILIKLPENKKESTQLNALLNSLRNSGLCELTAVKAVAVTTEDEHVAALVARYGVFTREDHKFLSPPPPAFSKNGMGHGEEPPEGTTERTTFTNVATGVVHSLGEMRQLLRYKRVNPHEQFINSRRGLVEAVKMGDKIVLRMAKESQEKH